MLILYFSNNLDIYDIVDKLPEQLFSVWLFSYPGDKILFLLKFNEARISELNIYRRLYNVISVENILRRNKNHGTPAKKELICFW